MDKLSYALGLSMIMTLNFIGNFRLTTFSLGKHFILQTAGKYHHTGTLGILCQKFFSGLFIRLGDFISDTRLGGSLAVNARGFSLEIIYTF